MAYLLEIHISHDRVSVKYTIAASFGGHLACGFPCDLDSAHQRKEQHLVRIEIAALATSGKADRRIQRVGEVLQSYPVTRIHIAPGPRGAPRRENSGSNPRLYAGPPAVPPARPTALARSLRGLKG